jgi:hypothetical protein
MAEMFLIRTVFWLALVIALIPASEQQPGENAPVISTGDSLGALRSTLADFGQFCTRNPGACATGSAVLLQFGAKAKNGAETAYAYLERHLGQTDDKSDAPDSIQTGGVLADQED